jgi:hypothetical protein
MLVLTTSKGQELIVLGLYIYFEGTIYHMTMLDYLNLTTAETLAIRHWATVNHNVPQSCDLTSQTDVRIKQLLLANCFCLGTLANDPDPTIAMEARNRLNVLYPTAAA